MKVIYSDNAVSVAFVCAEGAWLQKFCSRHGMHFNIFFLLKRFQLTTTCLQYIQQKHVPKIRWKWKRGHLLSTVQNAMATPVSQTKPLLCC